MILSMYAYMIACLHERSCYEYHMFWETPHWPKIAIAIYISNVSSKWIELGELFLKNVMS